MGGCFVTNMHVLMPSPQHMFVNPLSIGAWEPNVGLNRDKLEGTKPVELEILKPKANRPRLSWLHKSPLEVTK